MPYISKKLTEKELPNIDFFSQKRCIFESVILHNIGKLGNNAINGTVKHPATLDGLVKQCGCKDLKELHLKIREALYEYGILGQNQEKQNKKLLQFLYNHIKDEVRAYSAGSNAQKAYLDMMGISIGDSATKSEILSMLYKESMTVMEKEIKHIRKNLRLIKHKKQPDRTFEKAAAKKMVIKYLVEESAKVNPEITMEAMQKYSKELGAIYNEVNKKAQTEGKQYAENSEFVEATIKFFDSLKNK